MRLICFNGSPRGPRSNTQLLLNYFNSGLREAGNEEAEIFYLNRTNEYPSYIKKILQSSHILIALPLYTDSMPSIVKKFIEALAPLRHQLGDKHIGYIIQSGFPEPFHSRHLEIYLKKLTGRLGAHYIGTAVRGGVEVGQSLLRPFKKIQFYFQFKQFGYTFATNPTTFSPKIVKQLAGFEKITGWRKLFMLPFWLVVVRYDHWSMLLVRNRKWLKRHAKPEQTDLV